jgi:hypothetical protein
MSFPQACPSTEAVQVDSEQFLSDMPSPKNECYYINGDKGSLHLHEDSEWFTLISCAAS